MGKSKEMFMDLRMKEDDFRSLSPEVREMIQIQKIDEVNPQYKEDELWCQLKAKASNAYKALKSREFELRHGADVIPRREEVIHE